MSDIKKKFHVTDELLLWLIGVFQPVSKKEILKYLELNFQERGAQFSEDFIEAFLRKEAKSGNIIKVATKPPLYSLTLRGNLVNSKRIRNEKNKSRFFLLKKSYDGRIIPLREESAESLGGVAPSPQGGVASSLQERGTSYVSETSESQISDPSPRFGFRWSRISKQLLNQTGDLHSSRNNHDFLPFFCFANKEQIIKSGGTSENEKLIYDFKTIALMIGVSPELLVNMAYKPRIYYRTFYIQKRTGGERKIEAPRIYLKLTQRFINDYLLAELPQHDSVYSYRIGRSISANAILHKGKKFVGSIDIEDFFGSISLSHVMKHLKRNGFDEASASCISRLCLKDDRLPQGAPTSPIISNSILFDFDDHFSKHCKEHNLAYSRYADDITISGDNKNEIKKVMRQAENFLRNEYRLSINKKKTRIVSKFRQQKVTGAVINEGLRPPRKFRRKIRAAFHKVKGKENITKKRKLQLKGYISYLNIYPDVRETGETNRYAEVLGKIKVIKPKKTIKSKES